MVMIQTEIQKTVLSFRFFSFFFQKIKQISLILMGGNPSDMGSTKNIYIQKKAPAPGSHTKMINIKQFKTVNPTRGT